ncbi:sorting nexin-29-like isoform X2 [Branchiostoma lanceolatum]|uniref:sorting nexin-29-like isoform X2 n=1 Tax=Branchiostoma lanceolatum TaxID=7740 RepID=UPI003455F63F
MSGALADAHQAERQNLLDRLLDGVKQCQIRFGGRTELATDSDSRVVCLLNQFETVLQHGMKRAKGLAAIKQVTQQVTGINMKGETEPVFWQCMREHLNKHELQRYLMLQQVTTDAGRGRAWLRSALNEHSLERYLHSLLGNTNLLRQHYDDWAFVLDDERSSMLPNMAAGLGSILFAINIDKAELNTVKQASTASLLEPLATMVGNVTSGVTSQKPGEEPQPVYALDVPSGDTSSSKDKKKDKKKKKKKVATIIDSDSPPSPFYASKSQPMSEGSVSFKEPSLDFGTGSPPIAIVKPGDQVLARSYPSDSPDLSYLSSSFPTKTPPPTPYDSAMLTHQSQLQDSSDYMSARLNAMSMEQGEDEGMIAGAPQTLSTSFPVKTPPPTPYDSSMMKYQHALEEETDYISKKLKEVSSQEMSGSPSAPRWSISTGGSKDLGDSQSYDEDSMGEDIRRSSDNGSGNLMLYGEERTGEAADLFPVTAEDDFTSSETMSESHTRPESFPRSDSLPQYGADMESAAMAVVLAQQGLDISSVRTQGDGSVATTLPASSSPRHETMSTSELKQAVVAMMLRKDEVEEQNRSMRSLLDAEMENSARLRVETEELKKKHSLQQERSTTKIQALTRENEVLKHQLKKYVGAVQMLKRSGAQGSEILAGLVRVQEDEQPAPPPPPEGTVDYSEEAAQYKEKLIQVAEMHGELMQFNEHLHMDLLSKDNLIQRLKEELVELRGPLPEDSVTEETSGTDADLSLVTRALVNIWIPSVFLRGKASDTHHVYQVYIRIRDEEWNIYRRYAQFYELHSQMKKKFPSVASLGFPPKKAIGNKDSKFVEDRRKRLQNYLRHLMNVVVQNTQGLVAGAGRERLVGVLPFFGDPYPPISNKPSRSGPFGRKKSKQEAPAQQKQKQQQQQRHQSYMGL